MLTLLNITHCEPHLTHSSEYFEELTSGRSFRMERILSFAHPSPPDFWYEQPASEWVLLFRGEAELADEQTTYALTAGDYLLIPPHHRHRVVQVSDDAVWLAVHFE